MKLIEFPGGRGEVDLAATRSWYAQAEPWGCECGHCRNFLALARDRKLPKEMLALLDGHSGSICVESFDPLIVRWFRRHAPDILRGQLTSQASDLGASPLAGFALSRLLTNFLCRPHFIAHHTGRMALTVRLCHLMGAMRVCWTAHDRSWEKKNDAVIFEYGTPPAQYR